MQKVIKVGVQEGKGLIQKKSNAKGPFSFSHFPLVFQPEYFLTSFSEEVDSK